METIFEGRNRTSIEVDPQENILVRRNGVFVQINSMGTIIVGLEGKEASEIKLEKTTKVSTDFILFRHFRSSNWTPVKI